MFVKLKILFFISSFLLIASLSTAQEERCYSDSLLLIKCSDLIDEMLEKEQIYMNNNRFLDSLLSRNQGTCNLILWASVFDDFLKRDLKIDERLPKRQPRNNRFSVNQEKQISKTNPYSIHNLFRLFADFKIGFERKYDNIEDPKYVKTVEELIKYGRYSFPTIVKNILLQKYPEVNKDKIYRDMRYHIQND